jgi:hypothetical protein
LIGSIKVFEGLIFGSGRITEMFEFVKIFSLLVNKLNVNKIISTQQQKKLYFVLGNESAG